MNNSVTCKNCSAENPLYTHICVSCKYYLRDRVVNIDIWETIGKIIEDPSEAFKKIIYAEHKNFILFLTVLFGLRILIISRFVSLILAEEHSSASPLFLSFLISLISVFLIFTIISSITTLVLNKNDYNVRFKDVYTLNVYSNLPNYFAVTFLFILELVVFGEYLFSNNPNPFQVKPTIAYTFLTVELGLIIWSLALNYLAMFALTSKKSVSFYLTLLGYFFIITLVIILAVTIFFF